MEATDKRDPVDRLREFREEHPEVNIIPPSLENGPYWRAEKNGEQLVTDSYWLEWMLDKLEQQ